jgi:hypothetical protein
LESYNDERLENAKNLLKTTDRLFQFGANPDAFVSYFRTHVFPYIAGFALNIEAVKNFIFPRVSQIGINYRSSSLSVNNGNFSIKAGDRMPYFLLEGASIYDRLREPKFHLIAFSDGRHQPPDLGAVLTDRADSIDFHVVPLYPNIAEIFGARESFILLLRPDNYVGLISSDISPDAVRSYLNGFFTSTNP